MFILNIPRLWKHMLYKRGIYRPFIYMRLDVNALFMLETSFKQ